MLLPRNPDKKIFKAYFTMLLLSEGKKLSRPISPCSASHFKNEILFKSDFELSWWGPVLLFYPKDEVGQLVEKSGNVELSDWMKSC